ncbi:MAG: prephenate dehydratase [Caulobacterales bacterium 32-69-10]|nr:MAG: prephenate dehydratase [Caulobacterales bacterium 32-69-10]
MTLRMAFQGELGSNSHEACRTHFPDYEPVPNAVFEDAFDAVKSGDCQLGLIPVENSIAGRVADVHHLLPRSGLKIVGERFKPIHFNLMANRGVKLEEVRTVASMPGLDILMRDIEDEHHNTTRFLVMSADPNPPPPPFTERCVTSFVFRVRNVPAALYKAMGGFATAGVNITKLESYMEDGAWTATMFYAEADGRPEDRGLALAFEELGFFSEKFEILGVYPADPFRDRP